MNFEGKVILITGAASGIGAETAKHFAKLGGRIAAVDINSNKLKKLTQDIIKLGYNQPLEIVADVTKDTHIIISKTIEHFTKLDVLINNVGIVARQHFMDLEIDLYDRIMDTNVRSMVILTRLAVPYLIKTKGNVVNVSSVIGIRANPSLLTYAMSKAAINQFTKCIAVDLGPYGVRVNAIAPGLINTDMIKTIPESQRQNLVNYMTNALPLRRIGETNDIANAIAFLAGENASFTTGSLMCVDGGATAANILD